MTHEYVIALNGVVLGTGAAGTGAAGAASGGPPTALAWAADRVLAVGADAAVRAISRGDSTFLDLAGCAITPLPGDVEAAEQLVRHAVAEGRPFDPVRLLAAAGLLAADAALDVGAPADLAAWSDDPGTVAPSDAAGVHIVATVRAGRFGEGDPRAGPFARLGGSPGAHRPDR